MPELFIQPERRAIARKATALFHGKITVRWDQQQKIIGAIEGMAERAPEGLARGTNLAADRVRVNLINAVASETTLERSAIEAGIQVTAKATPSAPAARITVSDEAQPLDRFRVSEDSHGVRAQTFRNGPVRFITAAFIDTLPLGGFGVFQRAWQGWHRAGRLPVREQFGPSIKGALEDSGLIESQTEQARIELVNAIGEVRDEIVTEFLAEGSPASNIPGLSLARNVLRAPRGLIGAARGIFNDLFGPTIRNL